MTTATANFNPFAPAVKEKLHLRMGISGPAGSGKTWTALRLAGLMLGGVDYGDFGVTLPRRENGLARIAFIDTERESSTKYSADFPDTPGSMTAMFDVLRVVRNEQGACDPVEITKAVIAAGKFGYEFIIIDSLSHAWEGILDLKDKKDAGGRAGDRNSFTNWREITPIHNRLVDAMLDSPAHIIACMRVKMEHVQEPDPERPGRTRVRKIGLKSIVREGIEYEFDVLFDMSDEGSANVATVGKTRCHPIKKLVTIANPGLEAATIFNEWLATGVEVQQPMTRDEFVTAMGDMDFRTDDAIRAEIARLGLLSVSGPRKYNIIIERVREAKAPAEAE